MKPGFHVKVRGAPSDYRTLLHPVPDGVVISARMRGPVHLWHLFVRSRAELARHIRQAVRETDPYGMIWVSWPKRASGIRTDMTEDVVREVALPIGLVDIKVCAVNETWSGLKLVRRRSSPRPGADWDRKTAWPDGRPAGRRRSRGPGE